MAICQIAMSDKDMDLVFCITQYLNFSFVQLNKKTAQEVSVTHRDVVMLNVLNIPLCSEKTARVSPKLHCLLK